ncbi:MAG: hypothetical protein LQ337_002880 [Flavoplaca oasis]|nr:MAG: hypothetical protein LQ337_002880 [Flavoplaca oasis]
MANITDVIPQLDTVPQCIYPAYQTIAAAGCGLDLKCICTNDLFFATLQVFLAKGVCSPLEAQDAMANTRTICIAAAPYLGDTLVPEIIGSITVLTILAVGAVILRFLARSLSNVSYGLDDWLILFALVWECALSSVQFLGIRYGLGRHILMLDASATIPFGKIFFASTIFFHVSVATIKLSILFFYNQVFPIRKVMISCLVLGIFTVVWLISAIVANFFACRPLAYWWDKSIPGGHCLDTDITVFYVSSAPDIITNLAVLILPIPILWKLQMPTRRKVAVTIIFVLGSFIDSAIVGSIVRIPILHGLNRNNPTYTTVSPGIWLNVELSIGILSASLPLMRPLVSRAIPSQLRSRFSRSRKTGSYRLQDVEGPKAGTSGNSRAPHSKGLSDSGIYQGQNKRQPHKSWYNAGTYISSNGAGRHSKDGSEEDISTMSKTNCKASDATVVSTKPLMLEDARWTKLVLTTYKDPLGKQRTWEHAERATRPKDSSIDGVGIVAILEKPSGPELLLQKQFRPPVNKAVIEIPAGLVDAGESAAESAVRELREETGYVGQVSEVSPIMFNDPGFCNTNLNMVHVTVDMSLRQNQELKPELEDNEFIEVFSLPLKDLYAECKKLEMEGYAIDARVGTLAEGIELARRWKL